MVNEALTSNISKILTILHTQADDHVKKGERWSEQFALPPQSRIIINSVTKIGEPSGSGEPRLESGGGTAIVKTPEKIIKSTGLHEAPDNDDLKQLMANIPKGVDPEEYMEELKIGAMTQDEKATYEFKTLSGAVKEIFDQDAQEVHDDGVEKKKLRKKGGKKNADQVEVFKELD